MFNIKEKYSILPMDKRGNKKENYKIFWNNENVTYQYKAVPRQKFIALNVY